ncbi:predicted protein [Nematostella vectensis]|uniref:Ephrin RBD domain-containing protein n=1 Tax=Nematostella vectensis TaxID=45351 RepID=A7RL54_NEMVE|nr:predicted protein [Nematostella vectensis]|eukprot:XP_001639867.1 predicted protein [Nematostella vectensis]
MDLYLYRIVTLLVLMAANLSLVESMFYKSIVWSPQNPIFSGTAIKCVIPKSKMTIVCPTQALVVQDSPLIPPKEQLYENIWLVNRGSYDSCNISTADSEKRLLLRCDTPLVLKWYTLIFQEQSATAQGLEFVPEREYYFIATSTGDKSSLDSTAGGRCSSSRMRLQIHICRDVDDIHCKSEAQCQALLNKEESTVAPATTTQYHPTDDNFTEGYSRNNLTSTPAPCIGKPDSHGRRDFFTEMKYQFAVGFLTAVCLVFIVSTAYLGYRLYRKTKESPRMCSENGRFSMRASTRTTSDGADSIDGAEHELLRDSSHC